MAPAATDVRWPIPARIPPGWADAEIEPSPPSSGLCFASLLHGDDPMYFVYAMVLGRRLSQSLASDSPGVVVDCVLLCGPGCWTRDFGSRRALVCAGWNRLVPVDPIEAEHLDGSWTKRHRMVFTKLRVLQLPYRRVLFLDLDLLPRVGVDLTELFQVDAPAGKYHGHGFDGSLLAHGAVLPSRLVWDRVWCPNAGVLRLDPRPGYEARSAQLDDIIADVLVRRGASYLPEQYYLADKLQHWRHIGHQWNWEVRTESCDPGVLYPVEDAWRAARSYGWAGMHPGQSAAEVLASVRVWHFSGQGDTEPRGFMHCSSALETARLAQCVFASRDPGLVVSSALYEWREALDALQLEQASCLGSALAAAVRQLSLQARQARCDSVFFLCEMCCHPGRLREAAVSLAGDARLMLAGRRLCPTVWVCAECVVAWIRFRVRR